MQEIEQLYKLTETLAQVLDSDVSDDNRDTMIADVTDLLAQRDDLIQQLQPPITLEEQQRVEQITDLNKAVELKMQRHFKNLKQTMKQVQKQKKFNRFYGNKNHNGTSVDGMFLDSRK